MPTPLDKDNHGFNKRNAEANEVIADSQEKISTELTMIRRALERLVTAVEGIRSGSQHD